MFLEIDKKPTQKEAMVDDIGSVTYGDLVDFISNYHSLISKRCLIIILCEHSAATVAEFVASIENRVVPLMLGHDTDDQIVRNYISTYKPSYIWLPSRLLSKYGYEPIAEYRDSALVKLYDEPTPMYDELSLLLTTSGSTGSPKLVRHSYANVEATALNVSQAFGLKDDERAMISLPVNFTQGLSTVTSCLLVGGTALLTRATLVQRPFWRMMKEQHATSFTGVPYSYEILDKLKFTQMELPDLRIINQGGGRLTDAMFQKLSNYAKQTGKKFIASYGSTETTSRMAILPPELAEYKTGSIGKAICNGHIDICDDDGSVITETGKIGELVYSGANVTLGYGECTEDLLKGDERHGKYMTGDLAYADEDGCFFIVGRKKRFLKLFGYRIGLDETERLLKQNFGFDAACVGTDKKMIIYITADCDCESVILFLQNKTGINGHAFEVRKIDSLPKNESGKTLYSRLSNS